MRRNIPEAPVSIVTGSSRDLGEDIVMTLVKTRYTRNVLGIHKNPDHDRDQGQIARRVDGYDARMLRRRIDLSGPRAPDLIAATVVKDFGGQINALIVNAAGGYTRPNKDKLPIGVAIERARAFNVHAQVRLIDRLKGYIVDGGIIVFTNSDGGHRIGRMNDAEKEELGAYLPVAWSKYEMEHTLRNRSPEFSERGIRVGIVVGNALEGTFVSRLLKISNKIMVEKWKAMTEDGVFPSTADMAGAVGRVVRGNFPSGHTEYVGLKPEFQLYPPRLLGLRLFGAPLMMEGSIMSREEVESIIPQRWPFMFIGGVQKIEFGKRAVGTLVNLMHPDINWGEGHFPGRPLVPGTITQEGLEQLGSLVVSGLPGLREKIAVLRGVEMKFKDQIVPGEPIRLEAEGMHIQERRGIVFGDGHVRALNAVGRSAVEGNISFVMLDRSQLKAA